MLLKAFIITPLILFVLAVAKSQLTPTDFIAGLNKSCWSTRLHKNFILKRKDSRMKTERETMINKQLIERGIDDAPLLQAMATVPREYFVLPETQAMAYADSPLAIGYGQTISQPYIVALMIQAAELTPGSRVLDIGTGSGYAAAVLSRIVQHVDTIEVIPELSRRAEKTARLLGYNNITFKVGDGRLGLTESVAFDAILVAAASYDPPKILLEQLAINGKMIIPIGEQSMQNLLKITRVSAHQFTKEMIGSVRFVPLVNPQTLS